MVSSTQTSWPWGEGARWRGVGEVGGGRGETTQTKERNKSRGEEDGYRLMEKEQKEKRQM